MGMQGLSAQIPATPNSEEWHANMTSLTDEKRTKRRILHVAQPLVSSQNKVINYMSNISYKTATFVFVLSWDVAKTYSAVIESSLGPRTQSLRPCWDLSNVILKPSSNFQTVRLRYFAAAARSWQGRWKSICTPYETNMSSTCTGD